MYLRRLEDWGIEASSLSQQVGSSSSTYFSPISISHFLFLLLFHFIHHLYDSISFIVFVDPHFLERLSWDFFFLQLEGDSIFLRKYLFQHFEETQFRFLRGELAKKSGRQGLCIEDFLWKMWFWRWQTKCAEWILQRGGGWFLIFFRLVS